MTPALAAAGAAGLLLLAYTGATVQAGVSFLRRFRRSDAPAGSLLPPAEVLVAVRGADSGLEACLSALLHQDYPSYAVHVVVHDERDPAWEVARRVARRAGLIPFRVSPLRHERETCSLKCSALLQMTGELRSDTRVVAILDADILPHRGWLRELVSPLMHPGVGATFGIPWCVPREAGWGTVLRSRWWTIAGARMVLQGWPWGGSTALSVATLRAARLESRWSRALSSDMPVAEALAGIGLRATWVPSLVLLDQEECDIGELWRRLVRYTLVRRLYLSGWARERVLSGALGILVAVNGGMMVAALVGGALIEGAIAGGALLAYIAISGVVLGIADRSARAALRRAGMDVSPMAMAERVRRLVTLPAVLPLLLGAAVAAQRTRGVTWRGTRYRVSGPWEIRIAEESLGNPE